MVEERSSTERTSLHVYYESDVVSNSNLLSEAWAERGTFAFLSDKSGVSGEWIESRLNILPEKYRINHFVLLTSGSTGKPKIVVGDRQRAEKLTMVLHVLQENETVKESIVALPLAYCYAFVNQWLWARVQHRKLVLTSGLARPNELAEALEQAKDAMICLVGAQVPMLITYFHGKTFPGVIRVNFAGGRFPQERLSEIKELFPRASVFNNYGCAEAMPRLTLRRSEAAEVPYHIGWSLPGVEMTSDSESRLLFRSVYGAVAIVDDDGLTEVDGSMWVPTGDLGVQKEDGHWELLGRTGEVFKRHGEKISIPQIMSVVRPVWLEHVECYREVDPRGEEGYVLVLSPLPTAGRVMAILKALSKQYKRSHWPLRVESVSAMPILTNGKVDRKALAIHSQRTIHWRQVI